MSLAASHPLTRQQARNQLATLLSLLLFQLDDTAIARTRQVRTTRSNLLSPLLCLALDKRNDIGEVYNIMCHAMAANDWLFIMITETVCELETNGLKPEDAERVQQHHRTVRQTCEQ